jgi:hypothetical protein
MSKTVYAIIIVWTVCFLIGASTHALDILNGGWLPYDFAPLAFNIYWTALLPLDLFAALLLWLYRRAGIVLALIIMVSDVAINSYVAFFVVENWPMVFLKLQAGFMLFVLATARKIWNANSQTPEKE